MTSKNEKVNLEKAFELIQKGNQHEDDDNKLWEAVDCFDQAREILTNLSNKEKSSSTQSEEHEKIVALYRQQGEEYLIRARTALIKAMTAENEKDQASEKGVGESKTHAFLFQDLSEEDCKKRLSLFGRLFAKEPTGVFSQQSDVSKENSNTDAMSLEERLKQLNKSLPSGFKTDDERMKEINRGLGRLGLSLYSASDRTPGLSIEPPKSESDQVSDIIAQAKDEVALLGPSSTINSEGGKANPDISSKIGGIDTDAIADVLLDELEDEDESDIENDIDEEDEADLTEEVCKDIQDKLAEAQATIAELIAMFEVDHGGDAEIQLDQRRGKQSLKKARAMLLQVSKRWADS